MDVRIEAAAMTAEALVTTPKVIFQTFGFVSKVVALVAASFSVPSISGHSISAVAPDTNFTDRRLALGVAA